jgi:hypothetical protein
MPAQCGGRPSTASIFNPNHSLPDRCPTSLTELESLTLVPWAPAAHSFSLCCPRHLPHPVADRNGSSKQAACAVPDIRGKIFKMSNTRRKHFPGAPFWPGSHEQNNPGQVRMKKDDRGQE